jgi:hypothetical protein
MTIFKVGTTHMILWDHFKCSLNRHLLVYNEGMNIIKVETLFMIEESKKDSFSISSFSIYIYISFFP